MRWVGHIARAGKRRVVYRVLVEKPEGKRPLGKPGHRKEDNIKTDLRKMEWSKDWIELAQGRDRWRALVYSMRNFRVP